MNDVPALFHKDDVEAVVGVAADLGRKMGEGYPSMLDVMDTLAAQKYALSETPSPSEKTIYTALLAFQADCPILVKNKEAEIVSKTKGTKFSYKYIPLENIMEKIQPLLTTHGLVWTTGPCFSDNNTPALSYCLAYSPTEEKIQGKMPLMLGREPDSRSHGSALTYAKRQALEAVLNLVAQTDDDGARASGQSKQPQGDAKPVSKAEQAKVRTEIILAKKDEQGLLTAVGLERIEDLTVGSAKAIRQILAGNKDA